MASPPETLESPRLLHPELFNRTPVVGGHIRTKMEAMVAEADSLNADHSAEHGNDITVVIRTLNERDSLSALFDDICEQSHLDNLQVVVVDNESVDGTQQVADEHGADLITIRRDDFTYPKSLIAGIEAAKHNSVYLTVGHALLTSDQVLATAARRTSVFHQAGVFARTFPSVNASRSERLISTGNIGFLSQRLVTKAQMGVMAAQGAAVNALAWEALDGFDEHYELGGEDLQYGKKAIEHPCFEIFEDPVVSVHHTHGLSLMNTARQWKAWLDMGGPQQLDIKKLSKRRPDIDFSKRP